MSRKFRFAEECLNRLNEMYGRKNGKQQPAGEEKPVQEAAEEDAAKVPSALKNPSASEKKPETAPEATREEKAEETEKAEKAGEQTAAPQEEAVKAGGKAEEAKADAAAQPETDGKAGEKAAEKEAEPEKTAGEQPDPAEKEAKEEEKKDLVVTRTHIGRVRQSNQDALIEAYPLLGVADGMGGHKGGEVASGMTRDQMIALLKGKLPDGQTLRLAFDAVNRRVFIKSEENESLRGMGTTLSVLWLTKENVIIGHVGDSRVYRLRDGELKQITSDHSVVAEMVREGLLTREQAAIHPMRNVITRAVGTEDTVETDILTEPRKKGDLWLVCSDGLYGMVPDSALQETLKKEKTLEEAADRLLDLALENGGRDNISLVLLRDEEAAE